MMCKTFYLDFQILFKRKVLYYELKNSKMLSYFATNLTKSCIAIAFLFMIKTLVIELRNILYILVALIGHFKSIYKYINKYIKAKVKEKLG